MMPSWGEITKLPFFGALLSYFFQLQVEFEAKIMILFFNLRAAAVLILRDPQL